MLCFKYLRQIVAVPKQNLYHASKHKPGHAPSFSTTSCLRKVRKGRHGAYIPNKENKRGIDLIRDPALNKGLAFSLEERQLLKIHGLIPPHVISVREQEKRIIGNMKDMTDKEKYIYIMGLSDRNEKLFYKIIERHIEDMLPIIYTPTVGLACQHYGMIFRRPRGMFISINDRGHIFEVLCNWPERNIKAICVTDGERILGLGDLGAYGMGIPVGKLSLYTALGGIHPTKCLPILLDVGTNNEELYDDPLYIGRQKPRVTGKEYDDFIDEFMEAVVRRFGSNTLIQFEDFAQQNAPRFLEKYRNSYCMFNDDIQGTAAVATSGLLASQRITGKKIKDMKILFLGAGNASLGIANMITKAMVDEGLSVKDARSRINLVDMDGLVTSTRKEPIFGDGKFYVKNTEPMKDLHEIIKLVRPNAIIGASGAGGAFTKDIIKTMAEINDRPVIFALSNPTSKAECTAEAAYTHSEGRAIFASGSPFPPFKMPDGKTMVPGQGNNAYIFPGIVLAVITCKVHHISDGVFLKAARFVADAVSDADLAQGTVYPPLRGLKELSVKMAVKLAEDYYAEKLATTYPEPENKENFIRSFLYDTDYDNMIPDTWEWKDD